MIILPDEVHEAAIAEFEKHRSRFFALVGHCITRYQSIEDFLPEVFSGALGGDTGNAGAIFAIVRGLEAKLNMISAALTGADEPTIKRWSDLLKRVASAATARNEIAHARTVNNGGVIRVQAGGAGETGSVTRVKGPQMELRKRSGAGETVWTLELMIEEAERSSKLLGHLIAFAMTLKGEEPPPHLLEP